MFHQPVNTHIELVTGDDAGYGLVQTTEAPDEFYGRVYNMGGGPSCRFVFTDYMQRMMKMFGLGDSRKIMPLNWFGLRNFHCGWYADSDVLNSYLGHWRHSLEDHYKEVEDSVPWYLRMVKPVTSITPSFITSPFARTFMKRMAEPLRWIETNDEEKIKAFFGSRQKWQAIPEWKDYKLEPSSPEPPEAAQAGGPGQADPGIRPQPGAGAGRPVPVRQPDRPGDGTPLEVRPRARVRRQPPAHPGRPLVSEVPGAPLGLR